MRENFPYLFAAYTVIWAAVFFYVLALERRQKQLEGMLRRLRRSLRGGDEGAGREDEAVRAQEFE